MLIAAFYGTSTTAQAFVVAFRIPNLLRDLVGEGAANSAFIPVFSRTRALEGEASNARLAQAIWIRLLVGFLLASAVGMMLAPWAVNLMAPGFRGDPELFGRTVRLTRILFPYVGLVGMTAFFMGLLNSVNHFTLPSLGPVLFNIGMIVGIFLWRPDGLGLAWGVIAGGSLQAAIQWPVLRRAGFRLTLRCENHPGVAQIGRMLIPRVAGSSVYQVSVLIDTVFASFSQFVGPGGVAALYFANRFLHLPLALFGISMAQAALPTMASQVATQDLQATRRTCLLALRSSLFVAIPASIGLIVLGTPIIRVLLERGAFSAEATGMTAGALQGYALGVVSLCSVKVLANTLYAFHDTWTPVRSAAIALGLNLILNLILIGPLKLAGLALATSISSTWNGFHLYRAVCRRIGPMGRELKPWVWRVLAASIGMGLLVHGIWRMLIPSLGLIGAGAMLAALLGAILLAVGAFFLLGLLLRVEESRGLLEWLSRRG